MKITLVIMLLVILLIFVLLNRQQENFKATTTTSTTPISGYLSSCDLYFQVPNKDDLLLLGKDNKKTNAVLTLVPDNTLRYYDGRLMYKGNQLYHRPGSKKVNGKTSEVDSITTINFGSSYVIYYVKKDEKYVLMSDYNELLSVKVY